MNFDAKEEGVSDWQFDEIGRFGSERDARRWADRNRLDARDVHIRIDGDGVRLDVRRSASDGTREDDLRDGRRTGW